MEPYPTRQSLQRTAAATAVLALVLATAPVVPTLDADGELAFSSGTAQAKGKGGGRGGRGGHGGRGGPGRGHDGQADFGEDYGDRHAVGRGRGHNGHAGFGDDYDDGHGATFGHSDYRPGEGLGHEKAEGYGHHHDANYVGGSHDGHDGDYSDHRSSDQSFSAATDNARRDFGRAKSSAKKAWSDLWN